MFIERVRSKILTNPFRVVKKSQKTWVPLEDFVNRQLIAQVFMEFVCSRVSVAFFYFWKKKKNFQSFTLKPILFLKKLVILVRDRP